MQQSQYNDFLKCTVTAAYITVYLYTGLFGEMHLLTLILFTILTLVCILVSLDWIDYLTDPRGNTRG